MYFVYVYNVVYNSLMPYKDQISCMISGPLVSEASDNVEHIPSQKCAVVKFLVLKQFWGRSW